MRINNSSPSIYHINQRNNLTNNKELFKSTLLVQTVEKKEDEEKKDKSVEKKVSWLQQGKVLILDSILLIQTAQRFY